MWRLIALLFLPALLLLSAACEEEDGGGAGAPGGASSYTKNDPEYQLASLDKGKVLDLDDPSIDAYARALDAAEAKCTNKRSLLGDYALRAQQLLAEDGVDVTVLQALRAIDESIPDGSPKLDCAEIMAAWVVLMTSP